MTEARDIELLFAIWEQNVETVPALNRNLKQERLPKSGIATQLVSHLSNAPLPWSNPRTEPLVPTVPMRDRRKLSALRSTRAFLHSVSRSAFAARSIYASSQVNLASFADARPLTRITYATRNLEG
jgi:hypothetical protein